MNTVEETESALPAAAADDKPVYAAVDDVLALQAPKALSEDYRDDETGLCFRIEGMTKFHARLSVVAAAAQLNGRIRSGKIVVRDVDGEAFTPTGEQIEAAVLASRCVTRPRLGEMQWLATLGRSDLLSRLYLRILICNRDIDEASFDRMIEAAREALERGAYSQTEAKSV